MAKNQRDTVYHSRSHEGDGEGGHFDKYDKTQRNRSARRALERRLELKALNEMLEDEFEDEDLD